MSILDNKVVLITGGTGSFGKSFAKFLLENTKVKKLIIFSRDEFKQFHMAREMSDPHLRFFIGDVRERERLFRAFDGVDIVIHAAALKQIPILEYNPFEAVKTNILGSQNVIDAAIDRGVEQLLFVSTDKAAQPANLYGATKLCMERLAVDGNVYSKGRPTISCIRYGNVMGSRGSFIETLLQHKKEEKKTIPVTDERMTRFWITLEGSHELVVFALEHMKGGEIFIPKIPSMKIIEMCKAILPDVTCEFTGIRPGEKLHEMLISPFEARHTIELQDYFVVLPQREGLSNAEERFKEVFAKGKRVPQDFSYTSDNNTAWLSQSELREKIAYLEKTI